MPSRAPVDPISDTPRYASCLVMEHVLDRRLPGRAMTAAMVVDGELWVVVDLDKIGALGHAREMLTDPQLIGMVQDIEQQPV